MNLQRIELLIEKYEKGKSSRKEEVELKSFFENEDVPFHLAGYKDLFSFFKSSANESIQDPDFENKVLEAIAGLDNTAAPKATLRRLYPMMGIAAGILLLFSVYFVYQQQNQPLDTFSDPELAYLETRKILLKVSDNLNSGSDELSNMKEMGDGLDNLNNIKTFDEGMKTMRKISVLDKSKDIITQKTYKQ